tara:strand:+ start:384 stop:560 length:177 start_codon:yes stop_codon:yes gene_type:complete
MGNVVLAMFILVGFWVALMICWYLTIPFWVVVRHQGAAERQQAQAEKDLAWMAAFQNQ